MTAKMVSGSLACRIRALLPDVRCINIRYVLDRYDCARVIITACLAADWDGYQRAYMYDTGCADHQDALWTAAALRSHRSAHEPIGLQEFICSGLLAVRIRKALHYVNRIDMCSEALHDVVVTLGALQFRMHVAGSLARKHRYCIRQTEIPIPYREAPWDLRWILPEYRHVGELA